MKEDSDNSYRNVTLNDVQLASAYYPILIDLAKHKHCLTYSELVQQAKEASPNNPVVQNAIAVSTGRKLDVVRIFTSERGLPDLTSLIINKNNGECGAGFTRSFDPVAVREEVFSYDWSLVSSDFDGFVKYAEKSVTPRKRVNRQIAVKLMSDYYQNNKSSLPSSIKESRDLIIELLMDGFSPEEAFNQASNAEI